MDHAGLVKMGEHREQLKEVTLHLELGETLTTLEQLVHGLVVTDLEQDVDVFVVLEVVFEVYDIGVVKRLVDFYLGEQLKNKESIRK